MTLAIMTELRFPADLEREGASPEEDGILKGSLGIRILSGFGQFSVSDLMGAICNLP